MNDAILARFFACVLAIVCACQWNKASADEVIPGDEVNDPFLGDYEGEWTRGWPPRLVAQVFPRGEDAYQINFLEAFDHRCPPLAVVEATVDGTKLVFDHGGWSGAMDGDKLAGDGLIKGRSRPFALTKVVRRSPRVGAMPPEGAIVLFDGGDLDAWESDGRGGVEEILWKQIDDFIRVWPPISEHGFKAAIRTKDAWSDFHLHVEFRLPLIAGATGQTRANSGVIIEEFEFYEVQVLDSYGLPGYWNETGAIYKKAAPKVNMCAPPGQWQSYDITYHAPKFSDAGELIAKARITVDLNGRRVQNDVVLPFSEGAMKSRREKTEMKTPGRITLQHHGDPIDYRNIWIVPQGDASP